MSHALGQAIPPVPVAPPVPAVPTAVPATPAAPAGFNIWTSLCPPPGCCDKLKAHYCQSFLGQFLGSAFAPMRMMTGGMMKPCCPTANTPNAEDLKKAADSPAGAAARIKAEEAEAKARRADVRYLGTVDCNRYPEAEKALIKALRTDRNECVRWEAALALGNGCCCTKLTVEALMLTANASDKDGNPVETSPRVRHAAAYALSNCQTRPIDMTPEPPERPTPLPEPRKLPDMTRAGGATPPRTLPAAFGLPAIPTPASSQNTGFPIQPPVLPETPGVPTGQRGLFDIFMRRVQTTSASTPPR